MSFNVEPYSPDNLSELMSEAQDNQLMAATGSGTYETTGLTHDEMLNYAPASLSTQYPNPSQYPPLSGLGVSESLNPMFYVLGAAALGYYFFFYREKSHY